MIYLSALLVFPCCAVDDCPDDKPLTEQAADHRSGDEDDCGTCSPFFNCESCASGSVQVEMVQLNIPELSYSSIYTGFIDKDLDEPHYDFWRPPQLS